MGTSRETASPVPLPPALASPLKIIKTAARKDGCQLPEQQGVGQGQPSSELTYPPTVGLVSIHLAFFCVSVCLLVHFPVVLGIDPRASHTPGRDVLLLSWVFGRESPVMVLQPRASEFSS